MGVQKRFRQGQILKLLTGQPVASQEELRRQLGHLGMRVTQATLSRDLRELRLVKTAAGYRPLSAAAAEESSPLPALARALKEFLLRNDRLLKANGFDPPIGQIIHGLKGDLVVTENGLAAAMHRAGEPAVKHYLQTLMGRNWTNDKTLWSEEELKRIPAIEARLRDLPGIPCLRPLGH